MELALWVIAIAIALAGRWVSVSLDLLQERVKELIDQRAEEIADRQEDHGCR